MDNFKFTEEDNEAVRWCEKNYDGTICDVL